MYIFTQPGSECWSLWGAHLKRCCKELWDGCSEVSDAGSAGVYILLFLMCRLEALLGTNQTDSTETSVTSRMFILYCCCWVSWNCLYLQFQSSGGRFQFLKALESTLFFFMKSALSPVVSAVLEDVQRVYIVVAPSQYYGLEWKHVCGEWIWPIIFSVKFLFLKLSPSLRFLLHFFYNDGGRNTRLA